MQTYQLYWRRIMSRFKSLLISALSTIISIVGLSLPVSAPTPPQPVGGLVTEINKLEIIAPYIALVGIVAIASAVYLKRLKKQ